MLAGTVVGGLLIGASFAVGYIGGGNVAHRGYPDGLCGCLHQQKTASMVNASTASCAQDGAQQMAEGSASVFINSLPAARRS